MTPLDLVEGVLQGHDVAGMVVVDEVSVALIAADSRIELAAVTENGRRWGRGCGCGGRCGLQEVHHDRFRAEIRLQGTSVDLEDHLHVVCAAASADSPVEVISG